MGKGHSNTNDQPPHQTILEKATSSYLNFYPYSFQGTDTNL